MQITRLHIKNFLSFEDLDVSLIEKREGKFKGINRFNLFIGPNNEGKSNVLKGIQFAYAVIKVLKEYLNNKSILGELIWEIDDFNNIKQSELNFLKEEQDLFLGQTFEREISFSFGFKLSDSEAESIFRSKRTFPYPDFKNLFEASAAKIIGIHGKLKKEDGFFKIDLEKIDFPFYSNNGENPVLFDKNGWTIGRYSSTGEYLAKNLNDHANFFHVLANTQRPKAFFDVLKVFFTNLENIFSNSIKFIPSSRSIKEFSYDSHENHDDDAGRTARELSRHRDGMHAERQRFNEIKRFIRDLVFPGTKLEKIEMIFPRQKDGTHILKLNVDDRILPLSQLGTGIEQLVYLAVEILLVEKDTVFLMEEPETGFHPFMQRAFLRFLQDGLKHNNHQFFITTHSSVFIDPFLQNDSSTVFKVKLEGGRSSILEPLSNLEQASSLFFEMGIKGADYLLANGIVWVEGPSDRVYISKWLVLYCENNGRYVPKEGRDFSFLFYGGSVLSNFKIDSQVFDQFGETEFINLIKINRNVVVVMDRDSESRSKWETKKRISEEVEKLDSGYAWITDGKEIENYLAGENIKRAFKNKKKIWKKSGYEINAKTPLADYLADEIGKKLGNKKGFALNITKNMEKKDLESNKALLSHIETLYKKIEQWNSLGEKGEGNS